MDMLSVANTSNKAAPKAVGLNVEESQEMKSTKVKRKRDCDTTAPSVILKSALRLPESKLIICLLKQILTKHGVKYRARDRRDVLLRYFHRLSSAHRIDPNKKVKVTAGSSDTLTDIDHHSIDIVFEKLPKGPQLSKPMSTAAPPQTTSQESLPNSSPPPSRKSLLSEKAKPKPLDSDWRELLPPTRKQSNAGLDLRGEYCNYPSGYSLYDSCIVKLSTNFIELSASHYTLQEIAQILQHHGVNYHPQSSRVVLHKLYKNLLSRLKRLKVGAIAKLSKSETEDQVVHSTEPENINQPQPSSNTLITPDYLATPPPVRPSSCRYQHDSNVNKSAIKEDDAEISLLTQSTESHFHSPLSVSLQEATTQKASVEGKDDQPTSWTGNNSLNFETGNKYSLNELLAGPIKHSSCEEHSCIRESAISTSQVIKSITATSETQIPLAFEPLEAPGCCLVSGTEKGVDLDESQLKTPLQCSKSNVMMTLNDSMLPISSNLPILLPDISSSSPVTPKSASNHYHQAAKSTDKDSSNLEQNPVRSSPEETQYHEDSTVSRSKGEEQVGYMKEIDLLSELLKIPSKSSSPELAITKPEPHQPTSSTSKAASGTQPQVTMHVDASASTPETLGFKLAQASTPEVAESQDFDIFDIENVISLPNPCKTSPQSGDKDAIILDNPAPLTCPAAGSRSDEDNPQVPIRRLRKSRMILADDSDLGSVIGEMKQPSPSHQVKRTIDELGIFKEPRLSYSPAGKLTSKQIKKILMDHEVSLPNQCTRKTLVDKYNNMISSSRPRLRRKIKLPPPPSQCRRQVKHRPSPNTSKGPSKLRQKLMDQDNLFSALNKPFSPKEEYNFPRVSVSPDPKSASTLDPKAESQTKVDIGKRDESASKQKKDHFLSSNLNSTSIKPSHVGPPCDGGIPVEPMHNLHDVLSEPPIKAATPPEALILHQPESLMGNMSSKTNIERTSDTSLVLVLPVTTEILEVEEAVIPTVHSRHSSKELNGAKMPNNNPPWDSSENVELPVISVPPSQIFPSSDDFSNQEDQSNLLMTPINLQPHSANKVAGEKTTSDLLGLPPASDLTIKKIKEILTAKGIPFKRRAPRQVLVDHYNHLLSLRGVDCSKEPSVSTHLAEQPLPTHIESTNSLELSSNSFDAETLFLNFSKEQLLKYLAPYHLNRPSLSKADLVLLCQACQKKGKQPFLSSESPQPPPVDQTCGLIPSPSSLANQLADTFMDVTRQISVNDIGTLSAPLDREAQSPTHINNDPVSGLQHHPQIADLILSLSTLPQLQQETILAINRVLSSIELTSQKMGLKVDDVLHHLQSMIQAIKTPECSIPTFQLSAAKSQTSIPRAGPLHDVIRTFCTTLLGLKKGEALPSPATEKEKQKWHENIDEDDEMIQFEDTDFDFGNDSSSLHPNGLDHPDATPETLRIIRRSMKQNGVQSFHPNFAEPVSSPDNRFLWGLALEILIQLIDLQEYPTISLEMYDRETIFKALKTHVADTLMRRYRQENKWKKEQRLSAGKRLRQKARANKLRQGRVAALLAEPGLCNLAAIVDECCSEDVTDSEAPGKDPESESSSGEIEIAEVAGATPKMSKQHLRKKKVFVAQHYIWRSPLLNQIMLLIDDWHRKKKESSSRRSPGPKPTT
ncbi:hypothetical protein O181_045958 [Austropuccinia psidii MF-1]|uniref:Uncharacterized protein n=1 Tax=Austropuccinia psidii MF-1 TaxID=1389203 RepID=A0A9Q3HI30_9BASI|nr:hypothetical protein [Austropuccinia psidii MF-1]